MPLNKKGKKIMNAMKEQYGKERGEEVFYATKNKGKIKGVEKAAMGKAVKPRIGQFAKDIGVEYNQAKGLIEEGRRRMDGGSQVIAENLNKMKPDEDKTIRPTEAVRGTGAAMRGTKFSGVY